MSASCCGSARRTAALVVMAAALGSIAVWLVQSTRPDDGEATHQVEPDPQPTVEKKNKIWARLSEPGTVTIPDLVWYEVKAIQPESYVDVTAWFGDGLTREKLCLLQNVRVLHIEEVQELITGGGRPPLATAWVAADEKREPLVTLAVLRGCTFELVRRQPDDSAPDWNYDATLTRLKGLAKELRDAEPEVAPFPRAVP